MPKRIQRFVLVGNLLLLTVLLTTRRDWAAEIAITIAIVLGSAWSVWVDWREARSRWLALEALRLEAQPEIDRLIASALFADDPLDVWMSDCTGRIIPMIDWRVKSAIGDPSCRYSANSQVLRCAVNPCGPCEDCKDYEPVRAL